MASGGRDDDERRSAHSLTGRRRAPLGWLPWAALALLGVLGATAFLIARNVGDAGDDPGVDVVDDPAAAGQDPPGLDANVDDGADSGGAPDATTATDSTSAAAGQASVTAAPSNGAATTARPSAATVTPATTAASVAASVAPGGGTGVTPGTATLTAAGQAILPLPAAGLAPLATSPVAGTAVPVESVVSDEGFWVGTNTTDRLFVVLTPEARGSGGESPFQVEGGQSIALQGTLVALPDGGPAILGVESSEGADQLANQGYVIEATQVALG